VVVIGWGHVLVGWVEGGWWTVEASAAGGLEWGLEVGLCWGVPACGMMLGVPGCWILQPL
jgi:hypothetical protein